VRVLLPQHGVTETKRLRCELLVTCARPSQIRFTLFSHLEKKQCEESRNINLSYKTP